MKQIFLLLSFTLVSLAVFSQTRKSMRFIEEARVATNPYLNGAEKLDLESLGEVSGIVLDKVFVGQYSGKVGKIFAKSYDRVRMLIMDKLALENHSIFSYENSSSRYFGYRTGQHYGVQIIKSTGEVVEVNLEELEQNADGKVAIPNLEIGDIIDYCLYFEDTYYQDCFPGTIESISGNYPIINGYKRLEVDRGVFINYKALNGAPDLTKNESISDRRKLVYELNFDNIAPRIDEAWSPNRRTEPSFKLSMCYGVLSRTARSDQMIVDPYNVTNHVSDEIKKRTIANMRIGSLLSNDITIKQFRRWMRSTYKDTELTDSEYMEVSYYYLRYYTVIFNPVLNSYVENFHTSYIKFDYFMKLMKEVASDRLLDFRIIFTNNRYVSTFDDVIMSSELYRVFSYRDENGQWKYLETPTAYQTMDYVNPDLRGQKGLAIEYIANGRRYTESEVPIEVTLPMNTPEQNYYGTLFSISPDLESKEASVLVEKKLTGNYKYDNSKLYLRDTDYHLEVETSMLKKGAEDKFGNSGRRERGKSLSIEHVEGREGEKIKAMKKLWEDDGLELVSYDSFELVNTGVKSSEDTLIIKEELTVEDLFQKVGPNIVFNLGKIALDQISFSETEINERNYDVYYNYPKSLWYQYEITVPEGYEVKGFDALNITADNTFGMTEMRASMEGNILAIELNKVYKKQIVPKEDWDKVMEFITPAMKINEAQVVFQKKK